MLDQVQGTIMKTGTGEVDPDHNLTRIIAATTGATHNTHTPPIEVTAIGLTMTHHISLITDCPHIEVLQLTTPEIAVDHAYNHGTNLQGETHTDQVHIPAGHEANHTSRRT